LDERLRNLTDDANILGARTLRSFAFGVFDELAFGQAFIASAFDAGRMEEDLSLVALDEAETLIRQFLDRTLRHFEHTPGTQQRSFLSAAPRAVGVALRRVGLRTARANRPKRAK
jgi:hypothetical protein